MSAANLFTAPVDPGRASVALPAAPSAPSAEGIDVGAAYQASNLSTVLDELDRELVGLEPVKERLREIAALLLVARVREQAGLSTERPTLHMSFTGGPGTG